MSGDVAKVQMAGGARERSDGGRSAAGLPRMMSRTRPTAAGETPTRPSQPASTVLVTEVARITAPSRSALSQRPGSHVGSGGLECANDTRAMRLARINPMRGSCGVAFGRIDPDRPVHRCTLRLPAYGSDAARLAPNGA